MVWKRERTAFGQHPLVWVRGSRCELLHNLPVRRALLGAKLNGLFECKGGIRAMPRRSERLRALQAQISAAGGSWEAADTPQGRISLAQKRLLLGAEPPPEAVSLEEREARAKATYEAGAPMMAPGAPAAWDWRNVDGQSFVDPVGNQKSCGSCVAWGTIAPSRRRCGSRNTTLRSRSTFRRRICSIATPRRRVGPAPTAGGPTGRSRPSRAKASWTRGVSRTRPATRLARFAPTGVTA
jgi:Papain family cysteine protease